jgi:hypothetical protein
MKQSPEVVQRTQPIMMITLISIGAGSCPACACNYLKRINPTGTALSARYSKKLTSTVSILVS